MYLGVISKGTDEGGNSLGTESLETQSRRREEEPVTEIEAWL